MPSSFPRMRESSDLSFTSLDYALPSGTAGTIRLRRMRRRRVSPRRIRDGSYLLVVWGNPLDLTFFPCPASLDKG